MYASDWRRELSSSSFCGDDSQCTGLSYGTSVATQRRHNIPLTLLLLLVFFNV